MYGCVDVDIAYTPLRGRMRGKCVLILVGDE